MSGQGVQRRGFIKSLFAGAGAVAAWSTVAKAAPKPQALERQGNGKPASNLLLAEQDEVWTLVDGSKLPVRRIEVQLDFTPAVTWQFLPTDEMLRKWGYHVGPPMLGGPPAIYPEDGAMKRVQRRVFARFTEEQLRADYVAQKAGFDPVSTAAQLQKVSRGDLVKALEEKRAKVIAEDNATPFDEILRHRMTNCFIGWKPTRPEVYKSHDEWPDPHGVFLVVRGPTTLYALGVSEFPASSKNMLIQAPAAAIFGS